MGQPGTATGGAGSCSQRNNGIVRRIQPRERRLSMQLYAPTWLPGISFVELSKTLAR